MAPVECKHHLEEMKIGSGKDRLKAEFCMGECMMKSHGIVNEAGEIDKEMLKQIAENHIKGHPDLVKPVLDAVEKCLQLIGKLRYPEARDELLINNLYQ